MVMICLYYGVSYAALDIGKAMVDSTILNRSNLLHNCIRYISSDKWL
jgi:hypothetical protein